MACFVKEDWIRPEVLWRVAIDTVIMLSAKQVKKNRRTPKKIDIVDFVLCTKELGMFPTFNKKQQGSETKNMFRKKKKAGEKEQTRPEKMDDFLQCTKETGTFPNLIKATDNYQTATCADKRQQHVQTKDRGDPKEWVYGRKRQIEGIKINTNCNFADVFTGG